MKRRPKNKIKLFHYRTTFGPGKLPIKYFISRIVIDVGFRPRSISKTADAEARKIRDDLPRRTHKVLKSRKRRDRNRD